MLKVGPDLGVKQGHYIEDTSGNEVVPASKLSADGDTLAIRSPGTYHELSLKSQWKKKKRTKIRAARKWVALKNS